MFLPSCSHLLINILLLSHASGLMYNFFFILVDSGGSFIILQTRLACHLPVIYNEEYWKPHAHLLWILKSPLCSTLSHVAATHFDQQFVIVIELVFFHTSPVLQAMLGVTVFRNCGTCSPWVNNCHEKRPPIIGSKYLDNVLAQGLNKCSSICLVKTLLRFFWPLILEIQVEDVQDSYPSYPAVVELFNPILMNASNFLQLVQNFQWTMTQKILRVIQAFLPHRFSHWRRIP